MFQEMLMLKPKEPRIYRHDFLYDRTTKQWVYVIEYSIHRHVFLLSNNDECDSKGYSEFSGYARYATSTKGHIWVPEIKYNDIVEFTYHEQHYAGYYEKYKEMIDSHFMDIRYFDTIIKTKVR